MKNMFLLTILRLCNGYIQTRVVIGKPGTPIFEAVVYVLKKGEGGRHSPLFPGYRPQFYLM